MTAEDAEHQPLRQDCVSLRSLTRGWHPLWCIRVPRRLKSTRLYLGTRMHLGKAPSRGIISHTCLYIAVMVAAGAWGAEGARAIQDSGGRQLLQQGCFAQALRGFGPSVAAGLPSGWASVYTVRARAFPVSRRVACL